MNEHDVIRAWKDRTYRNSLSADDLAQLPEHPAGAVTLTDDELANVEGGTIPTTSTIILSAYVSYVLGTGGTVVSCCPCPPPLPLPPMPPPPPPPSGY